MMHSGFIKTICQMGIFMICAQAIVHFRPKASYEKYLKMLVSSMILIQLLGTVTGIFGTEGEQELLKKTEQFTERLEEGMRQASEITFFSGEEMQMQIMGENPTEAEGTVGTEIGIQDITVQINPIAPIRIEGESENSR